MATVVERRQLAHSPAPVHCSALGRPLDYWQQLECFNRNVFELIKDWRWTTQKTWKRIDHFKDTGLDPDWCGTFDLCIARGICAGVESLGSPKSGDYIRRIKLWLRIYR